LEGVDMTDPSEWEIIEPDDPGDEDGDTEEKTRSKLEIQQIATARQELQRALGRLKVVNVIRYASLPLAVIGAGVAATTAPIAFPLVALGAAAAVGLGDHYARKERREIDSRLNELKRHHAVRSSEANTILFTANTFTTAGSST
jgi:hypothetical protein